jgi:hypothetical protein
MRFPPAVVGVSLVDRAEGVRNGMPERLVPTSQGWRFNQPVLLVGLVMRVEMDSSETVYLTTLVVAVVELDRREVPLGMFRVDGLVSGVWDFGFRSFQH